MTYQKPNSIYTHINNTIANRVRDKRTYYHFIGCTETSYPYLRIFISNSISTANFLTKTEKLLAYCEAFIDTIEFLSFHYKDQAQCKIHFKRASVRTDQTPVTYDALKLEDYSLYFDDLNDYDLLLFVPDAEPFKDIFDQFSDTSIFHSDQFFTTLHDLTIKYKPILIHLGWYKYLPQTIDKDQPVNAVEIVIDIIKTPTIIEITHDIVELFAAKLDL